MIKKAIIIIVVIFIMTSCDALLSFWVSPVYNIPVSRSGWTVDMGNSRIVGDPEYFDNEEWSLDWLFGNNTLLFSDYNSDDNINVSTLGFPLEMSKYSKVNSPLFYLNLLFKHAATPIDIDLGGTVGIPQENIYLGRDGDTEVNVDYTMDVTTTVGQVASYTLPEPAYLGIDGTDTTTVLTGALNIVEFDIFSSNDFVTGNAVCVFANTNPAGLLYLVYYHDSGLVSVIYAHDVATTATGNYFPDGHYEYIWSVFRK